MKLLIIGAYPNSIVSFRGELIRSFVKAGHQVTVMTAEAEPQVVSQVEALGATFISYQVERNGLNPLADISTCKQLYKAINTYQPDKILAYTIKPIIWGGVAARIAGKGQFYAMITGLGYAFEASSILRKTINLIVRGLYKFALAKSCAVIFQNEENRSLFVELGLVKQKQTHRVYGSGVDLSLFQPADLPKRPLTFLLIARLLGDKGIREYIQAAKLIKKSNPEVNVQLLGPYDPSPDGIKPHEVRQWQEQGVVEYLGETNNVIPYIEQCHVYVLPSYHEGLPRTVLEAMAIGRAVITTDVCGCRDTVIDGHNGKLIEVKNEKALADAMQWFIGNPQQCQLMGKASREYAQRYFDVEKVNQNIMHIMSLLPSVEH